ncbi:MAG: NusG domain II-containing protein [Clostridia bacterium]|nr:NusG domain II-containing protein [Clostridia bacterium]
MQGRETRGRGKRIIADVTLLLALVLVGLSVFLVSELSGEAGEWAVVRIDGEEVGRYSLLCDGVYELNGGTNTLVISGGEAYVSEADCPDRVCVRTGHVSRNGERIICLPNKLEIKIVGGGEEVLTP